MNYLSNIAKRALFIEVTVVEVTKHITLKVYSICATKIYRTEDYEYDNKNTRFC